MRWIFRQEVACFTDVESDLLGLRRSVKAWQSVGRGACQVFWPLEGKLGFCISPIRGVVKQGSAESGVCGIRGVRKRGSAESGVS